MKTTDREFMNILKSRPLKIDEGKFYFIQNLSSYELELASDINRLKTFLKKWPGFYYFLLYFGSTIYFGGLSVKGAIRRVFGSDSLEDKVIINLGSGPRRHNKEIINVDVYPFLNVDVVADASALPFKDNSVDFVIAESLLEHLKNPKGAVSEMRRALKSGAYIYGITPFLYPYHSSPNDFYRWTGAGISELFSGFEVVAVGMRSGPVSSALSILMHILATIFSFGFKRAYIFLLSVFMVVLAPFKVFDAIFFLFPWSIESASFIYFLMRKK